jgi:hypothetical protein
MDVQARLNEFCAAVLENDTTQARECFDVLCTWLSRGGYRPDVLAAIEHAWENH